MSSKIITSFYDAITHQRDPYEGSHGGETARLAVAIAESLNMPAPEIILLKVAAHLHDVGKVGLPENLLNKNGRFTRPERFLVQQHTRIGYELLIPFSLGPLVLDVVLHHHERYDGRGYPDGYKADAVSLHADIVHIADVYNALTNERPYRMAMSHGEAVHLIKSDPGAHNPAVLETFLDVIKEGFE